MINQCWNILNKTTEMVKYSDAKATVMLSVYGVVTGLVYSNAMAISQLLDESWIHVLIIALAALFVVLSAVLSFSVIVPRLRVSANPSVIFFGDIKHRFSSSSQYSEELHEVLADEDEFKRQLADSIHINAQIAYRKFVRFNWSMKFFGAAFLLTGIDLLVYLFSR